MSDPKPEPFADLLRRAAKLSVDCKLLAGSIWNRPGEIEAARAAFAEACDAVIERLKKLDRSGGTVGCFAVDSRMACVYRPDEGTAEFVVLLPPNILDSFSRSGLEPRPTKASMTFWGSLAESAPEEPAR